MVPFASSVISQIIWGGIGGVDLERSEEGRKSTKRNLGIAQICGKLLTKEFQYRHYPNDSIFFALFEWANVKMVVEVTVERLHNAGHAGSVISRNKRCNKTLSVNMFTSNHVYL